MAGMLTVGVAGDRGAAGNWESGGVSACAGSAGVTMGCNCVSGGVSAGSEAGGGVTVGWTAGD